MITLNLLSGLIRVSDINSQLEISNRRTWDSGLTGEGQHRFKVPAFGDSSAVLSTGVPQVFKLPLRDDDAAGHGGNLPVVVNQRCTVNQPADYAHDEPDRFHCCRHDYRMFPQKLLEKKTIATLPKNPATANSLTTATFHQVLTGSNSVSSKLKPSGSQKQAGGDGGSGLALSVMSCYVLQHKDFILTGAINCRATPSVSPWPHNNWWWWLIM